MPTSATSPVPPEVDAQIDQFVHLYQHLKARKEGWEAALVGECWDLLWTGELPDWAMKLAEHGVPGTRWCPILDPGLRTRASSAG